MRSDSPDDRRTFIVRLTPRAAAPSRRWRASTRRWLLELFAGLDARTIEQLHTHLGTLRVHLVRNEQTLRDKA